MAIKITFTDTNTNKVIGEDELTDEQVKALNTELENASFTCPICGRKNTGIAGWCMNLIHNKARQKIDEIVELSGKGSKYTPIQRKLEIIREVEKEKPDLLKGTKQKMEETMQAMRKQGGLNGMGQK